jgi:hypothetical protein
MKHRIEAVHKKRGSSHIFIVDGDIQYFKDTHPSLNIVSVEEVRKYEKKNFNSPKRLRANLKARLCQIRGNLQSMTDSEEPFLTEEELVTIQRIACKVNRVISLFEMRTMDLKKGGVI